MIAIRALVVDDERPARDNICALLHGEPNWRVIGECDSASALRAAIASEVPDVVFLDIRLPGADGIALAAELQALTRPPLIVFTTAFETYAVAAFELQAIDYLMKPFDDLRFGAALRRVEHALTTQATPTQFRQRLVIRSIGRVQFVYAAQIDWLEASGNYVEIHTSTTSFLHRERLRVLEAELDPAMFVRVHRSAIVNRAAVVEVRPIAGGDSLVIMRGGAQLRMSRTHRVAL
ncbi:MAG: LytTR family DNA-binding domain-containing protein [Kofleriaceae bacterium]